MRRSRNKRRSRGLRERTQRGGMKKIFGKSKKDEDYFSELGGATTGVRTDDPLKKAYEERRQSRELKDLGFHPTKVHEDGSTDLQRLCYATDRHYDIYYPEIPLERRLEIIQLLISEGADVNEMAGNKKIGNKKTPLHYSCISHRETDGEISKLLIEAGADVNAVPGHGEETPLHSCLVCRHHKPKTVRMLLDAGAVVTTGADSDWSTPLRYACEEQDWNRKTASVEIVKMLLPEYAKEGIRDIIKYLGTDRYGNDVLHSGLYSQEIIVILQEYNTVQKRLALATETITGERDDALFAAMRGLEAGILGDIGRYVGIPGGAPGGGATG